MATDKNPIVFRVAGYQMPVGRDIEENARKITRAVDTASENGAEILLTPEGALSGYTHEFDTVAVAKKLDQITAYAASRQIGLALGTCFVEEDGRCCNQIRFYRPDGEYLGFHSKILCCGSVNGEASGEVNHYAVSELRTFQWRDGIWFGGLICNDMWANPGCTPMPDPHLSQQLAAMGADIILHAVNGGRNGSPLSDLTRQYHESNLRLRARAGEIWIVTVDNAYPEDLPCAAPSGVINPAGDFVYRARPNGEQLFVQTITINHSQVTCAQTAAGT